MRNVAAVLLILILIASTGCFTVKHRYNGSTVITNANALEGKPTNLRHFERHDRQWFLLFGLVGMGESLNGPKMAAQEAGPDQGIINFKLKDGMSTGDALLYGFVGLVGSYSVWVEGDVVE